MRIQGKTAIGNLAFPKKGKCLFCNFLEEPIGFLGYFFNFVWEDSGIIKMC